jgi:hypothetical protein
MDELPKKRGGPGRGQGRKPLDEAPSAVIQARVKRSQKEKFARIGGAKWLRKAIDAEPEPGEK